MSQAQGNESLSRAAKLLRSRVADLPVRVQADWEQDGAELYAGDSREWVGETLADGGDEVACYIATMQPKVALCIAEWLEGAAELRLPSHAAFNLARAVLRDES